MSPNPSQGRGLAACGQATRKNPTSCHFLECSLPQTASFHLGPNVDIVIFAHHSWSTYLNDSAIVLFAFFFGQTKNKIERKYKKAPLARFFEIIKTNPARKQNQDKTNREHVDIRAEARRFGGLLAHVFLPPKMLILFFLKKQFLWTKLLAHPSDSYLKPGLPFFVLVLFVLNPALPWNFTLTHKGIRN